MSRPNLAAPALATLLLALLPGTAAAERTIHSFAFDRARAHRYVEGHRIVGAGLPETRAFRTPRTRGLDYTIPTPAVEAVHIRYVPTGGRTLLRATLDDDVNVIFPDLPAAEGPATLTGLIREPLPPGEHRLRLTANNADIAWVALGRKEPPAALGNNLPPITRSVDLEPTLLVPPGGVLAFYLQPPAGAHLVLEAVGGGGPPRRVGVRVGVEGEAAPREIAAVDAAGTTPVPVRVDLGPYADKPIRLEFYATGPPGEPAVLLHPRLVLPGVDGQPARPPRQAASAIVWLVDTLRADRLKAYDPKTRVQGPAYERLAAEGVTFEACTAQGNESLSSHATLFTAQLPVRHRLTSPSRRLAADTQLLPEAIAKAGLRTAAYISNGYVSEKWGFKRGFSTYRNFIREGVPSHADVVWKHGAKYLDGVKAGERFFLYLGTIDPHVAYAAPKPWTLMYRTKPYNGKLRPRATGVWLDKWKGNGSKPPLSADDQDFITALYDGEVAYNDNVLGKLLDRMTESGLTRDTFLLVTSDHGEELFEHGSVGHGHTVREVVTHVPLFVWWPGTLPAGRRVSANVELTDVMPTVLDLLGVRLPETAQGESLVPLLADPAPVMPRAGFSFHGGVRSARLDRWKYVLLSRDERLYELTADPNEDTDVSGKHPLALRLLRETLALNRFANEKWRRSVHGSECSPTAAGAELLLAE